MVLPRPQPKRKLACKSELRLCSLCPKQAFFVGVDDDSMGNRHISILLTWNLSYSRDIPLNNNNNTLAKII